MDAFRQNIFASSSFIYQHVTTADDHNKPLNKLLKGAVDWRADFGVFVEIDGGDGAFADAFGRELEFLRILISLTHTIPKPSLVPAYLVDIFVSTAGTEAIETELLVRISLPAHR